MNSARLCRGLVAALFLFPVAGLADSGLYLGVGAGGATFDVDFSDSNFGNFPSSFEEDDTATKIFGGYHFDLPVIDLGIEVGYVNLGEPEFDVMGTNVNVETTGVHAFGIAALDLGLFDLYGKLGLISWDIEATVEGFSQSESDDGTDPAYGIGVRTGLGPLMLRGEYELYDLDDTDISMVSVSIAYLFD